jgi:proteasome accessory factor A
VNRIVGLETEFGCLVAHPAGRGEEPWPVRIKDYLFKKARVGALDKHHRDYEEPAGNGGFLLNGGRFYLDLGHLEYATPECRSVRDVVAYDLAGDAMIQASLDALGVADDVSFLKNNVDHVTGATFGCHENYLMRRETEFTPEALGALLSFLATRQIFSGAGRVGQADPTTFEIEPLPPFDKVDFQLSQRADHIMNDVYQWVQFNRAIINARDEPLADYRKYRRLHLLIGDSNMSPFATALKVGTTNLVLTLLEEGRLPSNVLLQDAVFATRSVSRSGRPDSPVTLYDGRGETALGIQEKFHAAAVEALVGRDEETDWVLENWAFVIDGLRANDLEMLLGAVDWASKKWLLETFRADQGLAWDDPWLQSLDLEYHNINPSRGLFYALPAVPEIADFNLRIRRESALREPPQDTRAKGRGIAVERFMETQMPYIVNWDSIAAADMHVLSLSDPFNTYELNARALVESAMM